MELCSALLSWESWVKLSWEELGFGGFSGSKAQIYGGLPSLDGHVAEAGVSVLRESLVDWNSVYRCF